jgi:hypothetical protein
MFGYSPIKFFVPSGLLVRDRILAIPLSGHDTFFEVISISSSASGQISGV